MAGVTAPGPDEREDEQSGVDRLQHRIIRGLEDRLCRRRRLIPVPEAELGVAPVGDQAAQPGLESAVAAVVDARLDVPHRLTLSRQLPETRGEVDVGTADVGVKPGLLRQLQAPHELRLSGRVSPHQLGGPNVVQRVDQRPVIADPP